MIQLDHEQNSPEWFASRLGLPTASSASKIITSTGAPSKQIDAYAETLAADKFAGKSIDHWQGNQFTERGHEVEDEAALWYSYERDVELVETGFCTDDLGRYGASPDRLVKGGGVLEIKCLPKGHMSAILRWHTKRTPEPTYLPQTYMEALVTDAPWVDLLFYHTDLPKAIIRIDRNSEMDKALKAGITSVTSKRDAIIKQLEEMAA